MNLFIVWMAYLGVILFFILCYLLSWLRVILQFVVHLSCFFLIIFPISIIFSNRSITLVAHIKEIIVRIAAIVFSERKQFWIHVHIYLIKSS